MLDITGTYWLMYSDPENIVNVEDTKKAPIPNTAGQDLVFNPFNNICGADPSKSSKSIVLARDPPSFRARRLGFPGLLGIDGRIAEEP